MPSSVARFSLPPGSPGLVVHAVQFIRKMGGGSQPALIRCSDDRLYVVKFFNNPQGSNVLANEVLGNELLNIFGFPIPRWKIVSVSNSFVKENPEAAFETSSGTSSVEVGLHFGVEFLGAEKTGQIYEWLPGGFANRLSNRGDFVGIYIFDIWANHCDNRQSLFLTKDENISFQAVFVDNGHLFGGPEWKQQRRYCESAHLDKRFNLNEWNEGIVEGWISRFESIDFSLVFQITQNVPRFWYGGDIERVADSLIQRLSMLRALLSEEKARRMKFFRLSQDDCLDARLSLHCFELPCHGSLRKGAGSCAAS